MGDSSYAVAVQAYCSFAFSNPLLLRSEIQALCNIIYKGLSNPENHYLVLTCANSLQNIVDIYTISVAPFIAKFFSRIFQLYNNESPEFSQEVEVEDDEEANEYLKVLEVYVEMRCQILLAIATIFNFYIEKFASNADDMNVLI